MNDLRRIAEAADTGTLKEVLLKPITVTSECNGSDARLYGLRWQLLLGVVPLSTSADHSAEVFEDAWRVCRERWDRVHGEVQQFKTFPQPVSRPTRYSRADPQYGDDGDSASECEVSENPLQPEKGSLYAFQYWVDSVRTEAKKDVDRLFWAVPLLEDNQVKTDIQDLLVSYCVMEKREYRQGMHELISFLFMTVHHDYELLQEDTVAAKDSSLAKVLARHLQSFEARQCMLPIVYALFSRVMGCGGMHLASWYYPEDATEITSVVNAVATIQEILLAEMDAELHRRLNVEYGVQGVSYLLRWLRLLFLREFSPDQVSLVWNAIFSEYYLYTVYNKPYALPDSLVIALGVSMLIYIKPVLMDDCSEALRHLMKYPSTNDIQALLALGMEVRGPNSVLGKYVASQCCTPQPRADRKDGCAEGLLLRQGNTLAAVIRTLEQKWFPPVHETAEQRQDREHRYVEAIAELKKVRDVLLFGVDE